MRPSPTTAGCRRLPRSASCASGRRGGSSKSPASNFAEDEKARSPVFARGFGVVTRLRKAGPGLAPIVRALRGPAKAFRSQQALQRPGGVIGDVGHEAEFALRPQDASQAGHHLILNEAAFPM